MAIINRKKIRQQSGGGKLQKKRKKKIKMEEDEEGRNVLHHWISEIKMTRSMQFISYQIGGEKSKLGLKQNHGCKRGGKWWTISNRQFMWFSKMFWIGYGISLNRSSIVWLLVMDAASRIKLWSKQLKTAEIRRFERPQLVETCLKGLKVPTFDCEKEESKDLLSVVLSSKDWKDLLQARVGQHWEPTRGKETNHVPAWNCDSQ